MLLKGIYPCLLMLVITSSVALCQSAKSDSAGKAAKTDVKNFRLDAPEWKAFKAHRFNPSSDYFKPTAANGGDTSMLRDSVYVQAFREKAYKKTLHRRTMGHNVMVYGGITIGVLLIAAAVTIAAVIAHINNH